MGGSTLLRGRSIHSTCQGSGAACGFLLSLRGPLHPQEGQSLCHCSQEQKPSEEAAPASPPTWTLPRTTQLFSRALEGPAQGTRTSRSSPNSDMCCLAWSKGQGPPPHCSLRQGDKPASQSPSCCVLRPRVAHLPTSGPGRSRE